MDEHFQCGCFYLSPSRLFPSCAGDLRIHCEIRPNSLFLEFTNIVVVEVNGFGIRLCCRKSIPGIAPQNHDPVRAESKSTQHLSKWHQSVDYSSAAVVLQFRRNEDGYVRRRTNCTRRTDISKFPLITPVVYLVLYSLHNRCNVAVRRLGMAGECRERERNTSVKP
jgi:hypothetical protein